MAQSTNIFDQYVNKPFTNRLKDTGFLLKNSFSVIGKDKDIIIPTIRMAIFSAILITLFFAAIGTFLTGYYVGWGVLVLFIVGCVLVPFKFFYYIRQKADQSWIVYNTITGKDISYTQAHQHTATQKSNLRKIALVEMLMAYVGSRRTNERGIKAALVNLFISALVEIWDLLSHYMIPAVVIEQKPLMQIIPQIKSLKNNIPATLVGVFGIDIVGNVLARILLPVGSVAVLISIGIGYMLVSTFPTTVLTFFGFSFSWIPVYITLYVIFLIGSLLQKIIESTKVIYFTIFYTTIRMPLSIVKEMRDELTHYLLLNVPAEDVTPKQQAIAQLTTFVELYAKEGYSEKQVRDFLLSKGYALKDINNAFASMQQK